MDISKARALLREYRNGTLTKKGRAMLESWYLDNARSRKDLPEPDDLDAALDEVWEKLSDEKAALPGKKIFSRSYQWVARLGIAASVLLAVGIWLFRAHTTSHGDQDAQVSESSLPANAVNSRAYLTLADGRKIDLEKAGPGVLIEEDFLSFTKTAEGELVYGKKNTDEAGNPAREGRYHEVSTPNAGQYMIRLPDETKVWLNAGSTLRFPEAFNEKERVVEVTGEAYFEVAKALYRDRRIPFKVKTAHQVIEVLGTVFNVNSYADEHVIKTTLVEGSIRVNFINAANREVLLKPGQQLRYSEKEAADLSAGEAVRLDVSQVDAQFEVAWKHGFFRFNNASLEELMRQICRWYNMDVEYHGVSTKHEFVGEIERSAPLAEVLAILEVGNLSFTLDGRKIIVTNEPREN
ncbi:MAG: hypothetical protein ABS46_19300 [Cytophagaceae bacterium SCN 52-12]|nr:MAG: hypothetical protein ABS46_19300 [Cytophagaceae bacterium SCN 52-12]